MTERPFSRALFRGQEGSSFSLSHPLVETGPAPATSGGPSVMVLDRIEEGPSAPGQEQYALIFQAESDEVLMQGTYHLDHGTLGGLELFLVPIGRTGRTVEYQACFNHLQAGD